VRLAVIGSGIAGLSCAWRLARDHAVTLYEANDYLGGHSHTVDACVDGVSHPVDTGFLVFNQRTYPGLVELFRELKVDTSASEMSFSASIALPGGRSLEWAGTDLNSVFAQRLNALRPDFLRMLSDIMRFNRQVTFRALAGNTYAQIALGDFLDQEGFSKAFRDWYLLPMAAAIWSCPTRQMLEFPLSTFARFCHNHGLLQVVDRPQWYTVTGGAREYVKKIAATIPDIRLNEPVLEVERHGHSGKVAVKTARATERFDGVVLACHSDQALHLLADPSHGETTLLGAVRYQNNRVVLHTDASVLPRARRAWAAWNYQSQPSTVGDQQASVCVHYLINKLQPLPFRRPVLVSLNPVTPPDARSVLAEFDAAHPVFDRPAIAAQQRLAGLQGRANTWYCGAWTGYGFHEDGLQSGLAVATMINSSQIRALAA